jgi:hypothetical protein
LASEQLDKSPSKSVNQLSPDDQLLRVLAKRAWLVELYEAFLLRSSETGLSVFFDCTPSEAVALSELNRSFGVAGLFVQSVTSLELAVVADEPRHANIQGLPHKETDPSRAEWLARRLSEAAQILDRTKREQ